METFADWVQFSVAAAVVVLFLCIIVLLLSFLRGRGPAKRDKESVHVRILNRQLQEQKDALLQEILSDDEWKELRKNQRRSEKKGDKASVEKKAPRKRVFVLDFDGDVAASATSVLRKLVTNVLQIARPEDEVVVRLESPGGMVHAYGLAASQLLRIRDRGIGLTVVVDKVAASGGYMMACVANRIVAAPFAIIGSIGAVSALMNFNRTLRKADVEYIELTAGEHKRTLSLFGEVTDKGKAKHLEQLQLIHRLFKEHVARFRPEIDLENVATGDFWPASVALDLKLVDRLQTSDDYLVEASANADVLVLSMEHEQNWRHKLMKQFFGAVRAMSRTWEHRLPQAHI